MALMPVVLIGLSGAIYDPVYLSGGLLLLGFVLVYGLQKIFFK
jgi:hypothetical protein